MWVRGRLDQHLPHEAGPKGAGVAYVREGAWFERRLALVDARRQVDELNARALALRETTAFWKRVEEATRFRHVQWVAETDDGPCAHHRCGCDSGAGGRW